MGCDGPTYDGAVVDSVCSFELTVLSVPTNISRDCTRAGFRYRPDGGAFGRRNRRRNVLGSAMDINYGLRFIQSCMKSACPCGLSRLFFCSCWSCSAQPENFSLFLAQRLFAAAIR